MKLLKTIALLALVGLAALDVGATLARDTRTETDQPRGGGAEGGTSYGDNLPEPEPGLPTTTKGFSCVVVDSKLADYEAVITNNTGVIIPEGTQITIYIQPGDIQKTFKLSKYWMPAADIFTLVHGEFDGPMECAFRISYRKGEKEDSTPTFKVPERGDPLTIEAHQTVELSCKIGINENGDYYIFVEQDAVKVMPAGAVITMTTHPDGKVYTATTSQKIYKGGGPVWLDPKFRAGGVPTSCTATATW